MPGMRGPGSAGDCTFRAVQGSLVRPRPESTLRLLVHSPGWSTVFRSSLGRLRTIGLLEGLSFLVLLGVAMPLKYLAGMPEMVRVVGMAHGVLFILFGLAVVQVAVERRWPPARVALALAASVLPFGPFVLDARLLRRELEAEARSGKEPVPA